MTMIDEIMIELRPTSQLPSSEGPSLTHLYIWSMSEYRLKVLFRSMIQFLITLFSWRFDFGRFSRIKRLGKDPFSPISYSSVLRYRLTWYRAKHCTTALKK